jgi:hypothetical protein
VALAALALFALETARRLSAMADWQQRLGDSHATVYVRLGELLFWLACHVGGVVSHAGQRMQHAQRALLALWLLAMTAGTPLLTLVLANKPDFVGQGFAVGCGVFGWTILVESSAAYDRVQRVSRRVDLLPTLVRIVVISILDIAICWLALSGVIGGEPIASIFAGASFVAAADLVSTLVGVAAAAFPDYPLLDPP